MKSKFKSGSLKTLLSITVYTYNTMAQREIRSIIIICIATDRRDLNPSRTLWVEVDPYFHSLVHISINIQAIMLKFYDFVDKGTDCVLTKNDTVPSYNKQVIKQQKNNISLPIPRGCTHTHTPKEGTMRAVRRGCTHTHTPKEGTMRAVRRGCTHTHALKEGTESAHITKCVRIVTANLQD